MTICAPDFTPAGTPGRSKRLCGDIATINNNRAGKEMFQVSKASSMMDFCWSKHAQCDFGPLPAASTPQRCRADCRALAGIVAGRQSFPCKNDSHLFCQLSSSMLTFLTWQLSHNLLAPRPLGAAGTEEERGELLRLTCLGALKGGAMMHLHPFDEFPSDTLTVFPFTISIVCSL